jgi:CHAD domain-containing protein
MKSQKLYRQWSSRVRQLHGDIDQLSLARSSDIDAETIHALRVLLRRLRLFAKIGKPILGTAITIEFRHWSRSTLDRLGRIRDFDICFEWLQRQGVAGAFTSHLIKARNRRLQNLRGFVSTIPRGLAGLDRVTKVQLEQQDSLNRRYRRQLKECGEIICKQSMHVERVKPADLHHFRRYVRRLRYLRELALPEAKFKNDRLLRRLLKLQDALGEVQNSRVLLLALPKLCGRAAAAPLIRVLRKNESQGLRLAAKSLRQVKAILGGR